MTDAITHDRRDPQESDLPKELSNARGLSFTAEPGSKDKGAQP